MTAPRGKRRGRLRRWLGLLVCFGAGIALGLTILWHLSPYPAVRLDAYPSSLRVLDRQGRALRVFPATSGEMRLPVPLAEMSPWLPRAMVAVEDRRFRSHPGVDVAAVLRAVWQNAQAGRVLSGASTISQQLVRILDERPRTLGSKLVESFRAVQLEAQRSKDELLEAYLNLVPMGGNVRGVEAAAWRYLGKSCRDLTLAEAALLAGLPQSPSRLRPDRHPQRAFERRAVVLAAMVREGAISKAEAEAADRDRPRMEPRAWPFAAPHFAEWLRQAAEPGTLASGTWRSTLDLETQRRAEAELGAFFAADRPGRARLSGAVVVLEVATGAVRAMVGSPDYFARERHGMLNAAVRPRSPGSTLKPFVYALAFERGVAAPETVLLDLPVAYRSFVPENFDRLFQGPVPASEALARSLNVPAVRLQAQVGTVALLETLQALGLRSLRRPAGHYGLTLCLGSGETTLLELASAYATLARGGVPVEAWGHVPAVAHAAPRERSVLSPGACRLVLESLSGEEHLRQAAAVVLEGQDRPLAFKTGTSLGLRDAWAMACTPEHVVGVWLGDPEGRTHSDLVGVQSAAPVALSLARWLSSASLVDDWLPPTASVRTVAVCSQSGLPAGNSCPGRIEGHFAAAAPAAPPCPVHAERRIDRETGFELCVECGAGREHELLPVTLWPPEVEAWRRRQGLASGPPLPPHAPWCRRLPEGSPPRILTPVEGAEYRLADTGSAQRLHLSAAAPAAAGRLHWFVNGGPLASAAVGETVPWQLEPGAHSIRCVDDRGRGTTVRIRVR